jgi:hypothetical protein
MSNAALPTVASGTYRHTKTGKMYSVMGTALHTEDGSVVVVYKPLYVSSIALFVRPYEMFVDSVEIQGSSYPRFEKVGN